MAQFLSDAEFDALIEGKGPSAIAGAGDDEAVLKEARSIGSFVGDKRQINDSHRLQLLRSELNDPDRSPDSDAELRMEIKKLERRLGGEAPLAPSVTPASGAPEGYYAADDDPVILMRAGQPWRKQRTAAIEEEPAEKGYLGNLADLTVRGAKSALRGAELSKDITVGNVRDKAALIKEELDAQGKPKPKELQDVQQAFAPAGKEWSQARNVGESLEAIGSMIAAVGKTAVTQPKGTTYLFAEQAANMAAPIAAMLTGAAVGGAVLGPPGAVGGAVIGGVGGGATAEIGQEFVGQVAKELQSRKLDPTEENIRELMREPKWLMDTTNAVIRKGVTTAAVDTGLTMGAGRIITAPRRAAIAQATREGLNAADAARMGPRVEQILAERTLGQKTGRGAAALGTEIAGEGISEAAGQAAGYGQVDLADVGLETLGGVPGAAPGVATGAYATGRDLVAKAGGRTMTDVPAGAPAAETAPPAGAVAEPVAPPAGAIDPATGEPPKPVETRTDAELRKMATDEIEEMAARARKEPTVRQDERGTIVDPAAPLEDVERKQLDNLRQWTRTDNYDALAAYYEVNRAGGAEPVTPPAAAPAPAVTAAPAAPAAPDAEFEDLKKFEPGAREALKAAGLNVLDVDGTGKFGRITLDDIQRATTGRDRAQLRRGARDAQGQPDAALGDVAGKAPIDAGAVDAVVAREGATSSTAENLPDADTPTNFEVGGKQYRGTKIGKQSFARLQRFARLFGKELVLFDNPAGSWAGDGFYHPDTPKAIYLSSIAQGAPHMAIFGHELFHSLERDMPKIFQRLKRAVIKAAGPGAIEDFKKYYTGTLDTEDAYWNEIVSDVGGNRLQEVETWEKIFRGLDNHGMVMRVAQYVREMVGNAINFAKKQTGFATDKYVKDLEGVREAVSEAAIAYIKHAQKPTKAPAQQQVAAAQARAPPLAPPTAAQEAKSEALRQEIIARMSPQEIASLPAREAAAEAKVQAALAEAKPAKKAKPEPVAPKPAVAEAVAKSKAPTVEKFLEDYEVKKAWNNLEELEKVLDGIEEDIDVNAVPAWKQTLQQAFDRVQKRVIEMQDDQLDETLDGKKDEKTAEVMAEIDPAPPPPALSDATLLNLLDRVQAGNKDAQAELDKRTTVLPTDDDEAKLQKMMDRREMLDYQLFERMPKKKADKIQAERDQLAEEIYNLTYKDPGETKTKKYEPAVKQEASVGTQIVEGVKDLTITEADFTKLTNDFKEMFVAEPTNAVSMDTKLKGTKFITVKEANAKIESWKAHAKKQRGNSNRTVLSFFDLTGEWAQPWFDAGYNVITFDLQSGQNVLDFSSQYFVDNWDISDVYCILAAVPCTRFSAAGNKHRAVHAAGGGSKDMKLARALVWQTMRTIEYFRPSIWALENPVGTIQSETGLPDWRLAFNPHHFGPHPDFGKGYTKKTLIWGNFNPDLPTANVPGRKEDGGLGSVMHEKYGGSSMKTKNARSVTPEGFAYSFFMANNYNDLTPERRLIADYPEITNAVVVATQAGMSEKKIRDIVDEPYQNYEREEAAELLLEAMPAGKKPKPEPKAKKKAKKSPLRILETGDEAKAIMRSAIRTPAERAAAKNLTAQEASKLRADTASKILDIMKTLPAAREMAAVAFAGRAKKGWYRKGQRALREVFGEETPRFAALLAALSPQVSVESNLRNALNVWASWEAAGRPTDKQSIVNIMGDSVQQAPIANRQMAALIMLARSVGVPIRGGRATLAAAVQRFADVSEKNAQLVRNHSVLEAWVPNTVRALQSADASKLTLSGPKVDSFRRNLLGEMEEVTNDAWMAAYAYINQKLFGGALNVSGTEPGKGTAYLAMNARTRQAAQLLTDSTGEKWTPAEVQETIWSWAKTLYERSLAAGETRTMPQLLQDKVITDEMIGSTPDFGRLFNETEYRGILERAGLGAGRAGEDLGVQPPEARGEAPRPRGQAGPFGREAQGRFEQQAARRLERLKRDRAAEEAAVKRSAFRSTPAGPTLLGDSVAFTEPREWAPGWYEQFITRGDHAVGILSGRWSGDKLLELLHIRVLSDNRGKGMGEAAIRALVDNNGDTPIQVLHITPDARGFWVKMGTDVYKTETGENGTITRDLYAAARPASASESGAIRAGRGPATDQRQSGPDQGPEAAGAPEGPALKRSTLRARPTGAEADRLNEELDGVTQKIRDWHPGRLEAYINAAGELHVANLDVPIDERGQGWGTSKMRELLAWADQNNLQVSLDPRADTGKKEALARFYRNLGFVSSSSARNYDPSSGGELIRRSLSERAKRSELRTDNPGGEWLAEERDHNNEMGKTRWGSPARFGAVTGWYDAPIELPVDLLATFKGMRGEQRDVRQPSIDYLTKRMTEKGLPAAPFIMVDQTGTPWVNEGNHRIMVAKKLGWKTMPAEVRYFAGGEEEGGPLAPDTVQNLPRAKALKSEMRAEPSWYSELAVKVKAGPNSAPAAAWKGYVNGLKNKGVKGEEIEWSGINDFLDRPVTGNIPKEQLVDYLSKNGVRVEEAVLGGDGAKIEFSFGEWDMEDPEDDFFKEGADQYMDQARETIQKDRDRFGNKEPVTDEDVEEGAIQLARGAYYDDPERPSNMNITVDANGKIYKFIASQNYGDFDLFAPANQGNELDARGGESLWEKAFTGNRQESQARRRQNRMPDNPQIERLITSYLSEHLDINFFAEDAGAPFEQYTLPGGTNYSIYQLTVPGKRATRSGVATFTKEEDVADFLDHVSAEALAEGLDYGQNTPLTVQFFNFTPNETDKFIAAAAIKGGEVSSRPSEPGPIYRSSHLEEDNIVAHVRTKDRVDADGKKVLFLEEIQSDWAQEGREQGFQNPAAVKAYDDYLRDLGNRYIEAHIEEDFDEVLDLSKRKRLLQKVVDRKLPEQMADELGERGIWQGLLAARLAGKRGQPRGPFVQKTDSWVALALKRMMMKAVDEGYDKIAWTTGEQQGDRYPGLIERFDAIHALKNKVGAYQILGFERGASGPKVKATYTESDLASAVGKELAVKIVKDTADTVDRTMVYNNLDLKIGAEGMKTFYEMIVPKVANEILKKVGGDKVGTVEFGDKSRVKAVAKGVITGKKPPDHMVQPGFDITAAMKAQIAKGLPLFSSLRRPEEELDAVRRAPGVRFGFEPDFASESHRHAKTGEPGSVVEKAPATFKAMRTGKVTEAREFSAYDTRGKLVGTLSVVTKGEGLGAAKISVRENAQRRGYGTKLLDAADQAGVKIDVGANSYTSDGRALVTSWLEDKAKRTALRLPQGADIVYHVTRTGAAKTIASEGMKLFMPTNWTRGGGERYGDGSFFAFENLNDAVRWAGRMDYEVNRDLGTGKISILALKRDGSWEVDDSDPVSQLGAQGSWLKRRSAVKKGAVIEVAPVSLQDIKTASATHFENLGLEPNRSALRQTETEEFKDFFNDSKVVNPDGSPRMVVHGVPASQLGGKVFSAFDRMASGRKSVDSLGSWFTTPEQAELYGGSEAVLIPAYLSLKNPLILRRPAARAQAQIDSFNQLEELRKANGLTPEEAARQAELDAVARSGTGFPKVMRDEWKRITDTGNARFKRAQAAFDKARNNDTLRQLFNEAAKFPNAEAYRNRLIEQGYDGIIMESTIGDSGYRRSPADMFIAFHPEQIKSAIGNVGTFDTKSPDISRSSLREKPRVSLYDELPAKEPKPPSTSTVELLGLPPDLISKTFYMLKEGRSEQEVLDILDDMNVRDPAKALAALKRSSLRDMRVHVANAFANSTIAPPFMRAAVDVMADAIRPTETGEFNWWHRSIGTQYHKATINPHFKAVFDLAQKFLDHVAMFAIRAEKMAPSIFPPMSKLFRRGGLGLSTADNELVGRALAEGTLENGPNPHNGKVWTDAELISRYGMNAKQRGYYREARASIDQSLDDTTKALMAQIARTAKVPQAIIDSVLEQYQQLWVARDTLINAIPNPTTKSAIEAIKSINKVSGETASLKANGYAPLMRFGQFTVTVKDAAGNTVFFSMHETRADRARMERLAQRDPKFQGMAISVGELNDQQFKLFEGISPASMEAFVNAMPYTNAQQEEARQQYLRHAISNRSALQRMMNRREGTAGYTHDATRTLASFITSNARYGSKAVNGAPLFAAAANVPQGQGNVGREAMLLREYVMNPKEGAPKWRGFLFFQFLGASLAAGLVNLTQPVMMTLPYLAQYGTRRAAGSMTAALRDTQQWMTAKTVTSPRLLAALRRAAEQGIIEPQEIFQLMAAARSGASSFLGAKLMRVWGVNFAVTEIFNRTLTFSAAFRMAQSMPGVDPYAFAVQAVTDSQGLYNKANRPNWARETGIAGTLGTIAFTFKQYSIAYLEFLRRLYKQGVITKPGFMLALGMLFLAAGAEGMPGADDLDDLLETAAAWMGIPLNAKKAKRRFLRETLGMGKAASDFVLGGVSSVLPLDVQGRLGMQNLIPGTALLNPTRQDEAGKEALEVLGVTGSFGKTIGDFAGKLKQGEVIGAAKTLLPKALRDITQAYDMYTTGKMIDVKGRMTMPATPSDALIKAIGFNPAENAAEQELLGMLHTDKKIVQAKKREWHERLAKAIAEGDSTTRAAIVKEQQDWNRRYPDYTVQINWPSVQTKAQAMKKTRAERFIKSAPREMRQDARRELLNRE